MLRLVAQRHHLTFPRARRWHNLDHRATLVNAKLKWVKDRTLDSVVSREKHLRSILHLIHHLFAAAASASTISVHSLPRPRLRDPTSFLLRFPALFAQTSPSTFSLSPAAVALRDLELQTLTATESDQIDRLCRLLMLTADRSLPLHTLDLLRFDLGLDLHYRQTLIPRYRHLFSLVRPPGDERAWLRLVSWDPRLAVSELQRRSSASEDKGGCLAFPVSFTRGFGLKKKSVEWLKEWQTLPYTSPYADSSGLDPRTDVAEKRMVGVFHELLHLTVGKKTERRNVSNMRRPLGLPQKFTKVFERHPGIFYLSQKLATQTVVLREAYGGGRELLEKNPIVGVREKYLELMRVTRDDMENEEEECEDSDGEIAEYNSLGEERFCCCSASSAGIGFLCQSEFGETLKAKENYWDLYKFEF